MDFPLQLEDLLAPPSNSILLRVVPSTAVTVGGKLVIPDKGVLSFLKDVTLSSTCRKIPDTGDIFLDVVDARGDDIAELLEKSPGSTGIIVASSYGLSLLLHDEEDGADGGDIVKLSHGCLLVLIETRNDPSLFNIPDFVQRLQHISGDNNLSLKEPPKVLYQECEGNFVTAPLKDQFARQILNAVEKNDVSFFTNETRFPQIMDTIKRKSIGWVVWPRILLFLILDIANKTKWASVMHKMLPNLPVEERNLATRILENMKTKFGDFTLKQDTVAGISSTQMMLIQPLISTIVLGQQLSSLVVLSMSDILFKRASLAASKYTNCPCPSRNIPKLGDATQEQQMNLTIFSKPKGATAWSGHICKQGGRLVVKPNTHINFQIVNRSSRMVCWQLWNLPSNPAEQPALLLPYSDPAKIANLTQAGMKWPSPASAPKVHPEERQISFEMSEEGVESVIFFAWWTTDDGEIQYERMSQQIQVTA